MHAIENKTNMLFPANTAKREMTVHDIFPIKSNLNHMSVGRNIPKWPLLHNN